VEIPPAGGELAVTPTAGFENSTEFTIWLPGYDSDFFQLTL